MPPVIASSRKPKSRIVNGKIWVNDPRAKKGGYWRRIKPGRGVDVRSKDRTGAMPSAVRGGTIAKLGASALAAGVVAAGAAAIASRKGTSQQSTRSRPTLPEPVKKQLAGLPPIDKRGVLAGAVLLGAPVGGYLAARAKYRAGFEESARLANQMADELEKSDYQWTGKDKEIIKGQKIDPASVETDGKKQLVPDKLYGGTPASRHLIDQTVKNAGYNPNEYQDKIHKKASQVTLVANGFAGEKNTDAGVNVATNLEAAQDDKLFDDHHIVPISSEGFSPDFHDSKNVVRNMLGKVFKDGRNPVAVRMAAHAIAFKRKHPDVSINLVGYSGAGMAANEAAEILKKSGIDVKVANFGSPHFGLTKKVGAAVTFNTPGDSVTKNTPVRDEVVVPTVKNHFDYLSDPTTRQKLRDFFDGKEVSSDAVTPEQRQAAKQSRIAERQKIKETQARLRVIAAKRKEREKRSKAKAKAATKQSQKKDSMLPISNKKKVIALDNGNLLIPQPFYDDENQVYGSVMVEVEPDSAEYKEWRGDSVVAIVRSVTRSDKKPAGNRPTKAGYTWVERPGFKNGGFFRKIKNSGGGLAAKLVAGAVVAGAATAAAAVNKKQISQIAAGAKQRALQALPDKGKNLSREVHGKINQVANATEAAIDKKIGDKKPTTSQRIAKEVAIEVASTLTARAGGNLAGNIVGASTGNAPASIITGLGAGQLIKKGVRSKLYDHYGEGLQSEKGKRIVRGAVQLASIGANVGMAAVATRSIAESTEKPDATTGSSRSRQPTQEEREQIAAYKEKYEKRAREYRAENKEITDFAANLEGLSPDEVLGKLQEKGSELQSRQSSGRAIDDGFADGLQNTSKRQKMRNKKRKTDSDLDALSYSGSNWHSTLRVNPIASPVQIKQAYRQSLRTDSVNREAIDRAYREAWNVYPRMSIEFWTENL